MRWGFNALTYIFCFICVIYDFSCSDQKDRLLLFSVSLHLMTSTWAGLVGDLANERVFSVERLHFKCGNVEQTIFECVFGCANLCANQSDDQEFIWSLQQIINLSRGKFGGFCYSIMIKKCTKDKMSKTFISHTNKSRNFTSRKDRQTL